DRMDSANVDSADNESAEQEVADLDLIADFSKLLARITEARSLVVYLDHSVRGVDVSAAEDDPDSAVIESEGFEERSDALSPAETTSPGETTSPADTTADPDPESSADFSVAESGDEESSVDESSAATTPLPATKEELVNDERWTKYLSADASNAVKQLDVLAETVRNYRSGVRNGPFGRIVSEEKYHRESVRASALIRTWMRESLGGTLWSQLRLIANPGAQDYRNLLQRGRETLQPRFVSLTSRTGSYVLQIGVGLVVMVIAVYFFLVDGSRMTRTLMRLSPLDDNYEEQLLNEFDRTSRAVVLASVSSALVQGLLAAIAYYFLGFNSVILLFLLTSLMALVPFLGAASVWVPCVLYLLAVEERIGAAVFLGIYGMTAISSIDNVIKVYVLQGRSTLHPLFALLSVLGGVTVFGPIGIIVGPMVVVFLQTLLEILNHELMQEEPA
ncbi:MAG: AI-2E family transporter, partial [Planctomycetota bacterium]